MKQWDAVVFHSSLEDGRDSCKLVIDGFQLQGKTASGEKFTLDLRNTDVSMSGTASTLVCLQAAAGSDHPKFTVRDKSIIQGLQETGIPDVVDGLRQYQKRVWAWRSWLLASIAIIVFGTMGSVGLFLFYGVDLVVATLPYSVDAKLGELAFNSSLEGIPGYQGIETNKYVNDVVQQIVRRLTQPLADQPFKFVVKVVAAPHNNAFALPGGKIALFTGLLKTAESADEVAGVLAHEIIHVTHRHGLKKIVEQVGTGLLLGAIIGDSSAITEFILKQAKNSVGLKFSRDMERQADTEGFLLLKKAAFHPAGLKSFFKKLQQQQKQNPRSLEWFSTHPLTENRIANLQRMLDQLKNFQPQPIEGDWEKVRQLLQ